LPALKIVLREKVSRGRIASRLANLPPCLIGIDQKAAARAKHTAPAIVGFAVGCGLGAGCEIIIGLWALALPTGLAFLALVIGLASKLEERP
jgi:uncharacterized membrane protein YoaK (UPF0700 family)